MRGTSAPKPAFLSWRTIQPCSQNKGYINFRPAFPQQRAIPVNYFRPWSTSSSSLQEPHPRKLYKDEQKRKRLEKREAKKSNEELEGIRGDRGENQWRLTVGLEIHAQLNTPRKLFSGASRSFLLRQLLNNEQQMLEYPQRASRIQMLPYLT